MFKCLLGEKHVMHMRILSIVRKWGVVSAMVKQKVYSLTKDYEIIFCKNYSNKMHFRATFGLQDPSFHPVIPTLLGGLFTPFIDSVSCVWLWHRERWMRWTLWLLSFFTSGLEVSFSSVLIVNLDYYFHITLKPMAFGPSTIYLSVSMSYPDNWVIPLHSWKSFKAISYVDSLLQNPYELWVMSINRLRNQHLNTLVSQAPDLLIFRHHYFLAILSPHSHNETQSLFVIWKYYFKSLNSNILI